MRATTSCKNVETLPRKNNLSCFKSLLVTGLWDVILTSLLPPIQSCSSKFWAWSCIASNFDKGRRGDHKHKIMDRPFMPKYSTMSQVLLQLAVGCFDFLPFVTLCSPAKMLSRITVKFYFHLNRLILKKDLHMYISWFSLENGSRFEGSE